MCCLPFCLLFLLMFLTGLLFHRVILSSGSALSPLTADLSKGPLLARKFAGKVKCPTEPSSTMLQCLRDLPLKYFLESEVNPIRIYDASIPFFPFFLAF